MAEPTRPADHKICDPWPEPYYLKDGLRKVHPYHFKYNTWCKGRWRDRELLDIFADEFRDRTAAYYKTAIEKGDIAVNGKISDPSTVVRNGDVISHAVHRHEPPVTKEPIGIVHEDDELIVINKPAGVPVHPTGRYFHNSVSEIMRAERGGAFNPRPANRLDRLTSGIMFIGKTQKAADEISTRIRAHKVKKEYVARVLGEFPEGDIICEKPILQISPKLGLNRIRANGKSARTVFKRLAYYLPKPDLDDDAKRSPSLNGDADMPWRRLRGYSIVRCRPLTGRTHQIRVHLQFLGHPISNDPIYCNQRVFGPSLGGNDEHSDDDEDIMSRLSKMGKEEAAEAVAYHRDIAGDFHKRLAERMTGELCDVCGTELFSDPGDHELGIYLHAKKYASDDGTWSYETPLPLWSLPPPGFDGPTEATPESDPLAIDLSKLGLEDVPDEDDAKQPGAGV